jgi:hypothetical protein
MEGPVDRSIEPLSPLEDEPVRNEASPLAPFPLTLSDEITICPEPVRTPVPDTREMEPPMPREEDVDPAARRTEPPEPAEEDPGEICKSPASPPSEDPVESNMEPDEDAAESPVERDTNPLEDEPEEPEER